MPHINIDYFTAFFRFVYHYKCKKKKNNTEFLKKSLHLVIKKSNYFQRN